MSADLHLRNVEADLDLAGLSLRQAKALLDDHDRARTAELLQIIDSVSTGVRQIRTRQPVKEGVKC